jgi:hypothetical protein
MSKHLRLGIGGIVLALTSAGRGSEFESEDVYQPFLTDDEAEVMLRVQRRTILEEASGVRAFDSGGPWSLYRDGRKWVIHLRSPRSNPHAHQIAVLGPDFCSGDICMKAQGPNGDLLPFPLRHPLAEVLMVNLLSLGRGVLLHALGLSDKAGGLLFVGSSGAGKSTMAELWKDEEGIAILSDDRVIVREKEGRFWAYGTPWHGDVNLCSPERVPVDGIFIIRHGAQNRATPLEARTALTSLLVRSFPTYWSPEGMGFILEFLGRIGRAVPCYDLGFLPDRSVIDFVRAVDDV